MKDGLIRGYRDAILQVGTPVALAENDLSILPYGHSGTREVRAVKGFEDGVYLRLQFCEFRSVRTAGRAGSKQEAEKESE